MNDRITRASLDTVVRNLNARLEGEHGAACILKVQGRNGYLALDWIALGSGTMLDVEMVGTKRECYDHVWAMIRVLDRVTWRPNA
jgi:hypothetical protein